MLCFVHHHASWHAFHHIKPCIIYIRVVYENEKMRVDPVSEQGHSPEVLVSIGTL
jgi:hypothetical protein